MCLSIPAKLIEKDGNIGKADLDGNIVETNLSLIDGAEIGDYLLIHAGFAIQKYDEDEALQTLQMIRDTFDADT